MKKMSDRSRALSGALLAMALALPADALHAQGAKPLVIGLTTDDSGQYANSGGDERRGILMAIAEANAKGGVLGRKIETVHVDTETNPATGSRVAERMITRDGAAFLIGGVSSGVANAISQVAQKYGVIYFNTNSSAPTEAGENCHRVKFVWDGNGTNFSKAAVQSALKIYGKNWLLLTNDYVWGHSTAAATKKLLEQYGGTVVDELLVPQGTRDFTSYLLKIQQAQPDVVATAIGGDDQKAMRQQVAQLGLGEKPAWINNQQDWPDVYGLPLENLFGVFGTTWYWDLDRPGVKEFVARYQEAYPDAPINVPGNVFYNGYIATRELLAAVERAGTTNNVAVIKELEGLRMPADGRMQQHDAWIDPATHQVQQSIYLATANDRSAWEANPDAMFKILSVAAPEDVQDDGAPAACKLEPYESLPVYEP
jgi:branched-chain amino acid transport system substrate-binding protein